MTKKPALCYAVVRGAHFSGDFVVVRVTSEKARQFSGVEVGNINSTTRNKRDLIAKFPDEETAAGALAAYRERWKAHRPLIEAAERQLSIERTNRMASAMDALKAFQSTPNAGTQAAMDDIRSGNVKRVGSVDALMVDLAAPDDVKPETIADLQNLPIYSRTGRTAASGAPNMQNIPTRTPEGSAIRDALIRSKYGE